MRVLVSGGGIAGLTAATALTRHGIEVDVVERSMTWRTEGAGISLYPNGDRVLRSLGLDEAVADAGFRVETLRIMDATGSEVAVVPFGPWPGVGGATAINRDALQHVLLGAASGARFALGSAIDELDDSGSSVGVTFTDGSHAEYAVVVVAEGIRSTTRTAVFGHVDLRPTGQMYWRTAVPGAVIDMQTMVADDDRFAAMVPLGRDQTYISVQRRSTTPVAVEPGERITSMRTACHGLAGPVTAALDAIRSDDDVFVGPAEEVADIHWRRSRVVVIGDASHALSPSFGQGANLALEDAFVLAEELASTDVDAALDAFVARREPRVAFVQEKTTERVELVNRGASQRDLQAATELVAAHLSAPM